MRDPVSLSGTLLPGTQVKYLHTLVHLVKLPVQSCQMLKIVFECGIPENANLFYLVNVKIRAAAF